MRYVYLFFIVVLLGVLLLFETQNLEMTTISFLNYSTTLPVSLVAIISYIFGMVTGGFLLSLIRVLFQKATKSEVDVPLKQEK